MDFDDRFWKKVNVAGVDDCWEWNARKDRAGYGEFHLSGSTAKAHRVSYSIANPQEQITDFCILHKCDNPGCVNPSHLFKGTHADNVSDKCSKGRNKFKRHIGSKNGCSKLTELQVVEIRKLKGRIAQTKLATMYGVSQAAISNVLLNKGWNHVA